MIIKIEVDAASVLDRLETVRHERLSDWRRRVIEQVARDVLKQTIERNPVDTARCRSAWVASLEQLGEPPPPGWEGAHPDGEAVAEGAELGSLSVAESDSESDVRISNDVSYVRYLEFGTRKMAPFAMVRRSLAEARVFLGRGLPSLFGHRPE